jgi:hypothetical protein
MSGPLSTPLRGPLNLTRGPLPDQYDHSTTATVSSSLQILSKYACLRLSPTTITLVIDLQSSSNPLHLR